MVASSDFRVALLDTNIIDYAFKKPTKIIATEFIRTLSDQYTLVVSEYVRFEIYRGLEMGKIPGAKALVDSFEAYPVDKPTLDTAAALTTCYGRDETTRKNIRSYADGDIILGATAFMYKFMVVTANRSDFPAPYFNEVSHHRYTDARGKPLVTYVLKPDIQYLNEMLAICYPKS